LEFIEVGTIIKAHADRMIDSHDSINNCLSKVSSRIDNLHTAVIEAQEQKKITLAVAEELHSTLQSFVEATPSAAPPHSLTQTTTPPDANSYAK